jgi:hypothetical protein
MKESEKKQNGIKKIYTLLFTTVLCCSSFVVLTNTALAVSDTPMSAPMLAPNYMAILSENFTDGTMPPADWELDQTNPTETWHIDNTIPHYPSALSKPSATVHRGSSTALQDEWLITPNLDLSKYNDIFLNFYSYTCFYVTAYKRYVELNVKVSTDGGANWTNAWSFDDMYDLEHHFNDWTWYLQSVNLSSYAAGENNVKIAIQYYSNSTEQPSQQSFSIDNINVLVNTTSGFTCNAGGPYEWWWMRQYYFNPNKGVQFHGNFTNGTAPLQWLWDFGDGNTSPIPYYTWHFYNDVGIYNVTLTLTDNKTSPPLIAIDHTTVKLFLLEPPAIDIQPAPISLGIKANIINAADYNATYVNWTMKVTWGPLKIFKEKNVGNGICNCVIAGNSEIIRSKYYFFAFGRILFTISANPENIPGIEKTYNGLKIGPIVFVGKEA